MNVREIFREIGLRTTNSIIEGLNSIWVLLVYVVSPLSLALRCMLLEVWYNAPFNPSICGLSSLSKGWVIKTTRNDACNAFGFFHRLTSSIASMIADQLQLHMTTWLTARMSLLADWWRSIGCRGVRITQILDPQRCCQLELAETRRKHDPVDRNGLAQKNTGSLQESAECEQWNCQEYTEAGGNDNRQNPEKKTYMVRSCGKDGR